MTAPETAPVRHPAWCDRQLCAVSGETGEHRSVPVPANPAGALAEVTMWLEGVPEDTTGQHAEQGVFVLLDLAQDGERHVFLLSLDQAAAVGWLLARQATAGRGAVL